MSELNLGPADSGSRMKYVLIALFVLAIIAVGVFYLNPRKTAELTVTNVQSYSYTGEMHEVKGSGNIMGQAATAEHDLYVIATLRINNKLRIPLFANGINATYTAADGSEQVVQAVSTADLSRVEETFPDLKAKLPKPLDFSGTFAPEASQEGQVLLEFPGFTQDIWKQRKTAVMTVDFTHQAAQTVVIP